MLNKKKGGGKEGVIHCDQIKCRQSETQVRVTEVTTLTFRNRGPKPLCIFISLLCEAYERASGITRDVSFARVSTLMDARQVWKLTCRSEERRVGKEC